MSDCVVDASVVGFANGDIKGRKPGNVLDKRLGIIEQVVRGTRRLRYNTRLLGEYQKLVKLYRNDVVQALFELLDDAHRAVRVRRNSLSRQHHEIATRRCRWPSHDQHLVAAALEGNNPIIVVTEERLARCATAIQARFGIRIENLG